MHGPETGMIPLLLPALVVPLCRVSFGLCAFLVVLLSGCCGVLFSCCGCSVFPVWLFCSFLLLVFGVVAVWPALSWLCPLPPHPPWLVLAFWSSQCSAGPSLRVSGCICDGPVVIYFWYGVLWLIGSCLHSSSWQQRLRPCVGLCPLHHVVGVV